MSSTVSFTQELIKIPSQPNNPEALDAILKLALSQLQDFTIETFERSSVKSALVYNTDKRPESFRILFNAHLDIIPAKKEQERPRIVDGRIYGAGAMDMKAGVASMIAAFKETANRVAYPMALQLTTDEEVGGFQGAKYQVDQGVRADFVIAGEPTDFDIVYKAKGILQVKVTARGVTAHGAYPWRGDNALWKLHQFLTKLQAHFPQPDQDTWQTTVNLSRIETPNRSFNKIPDICSAWLDIRFTREDQDTVREKLSKLLPNDCSLEVVFFDPAMQTAENHMFINALAEHTEAVTGKPARRRGANGSSDARHFVAAGCAGVEFGPIGGGIGSDNEWVDIASIETYQRILKNFLLDPKLS
jgi:succinyl-diaminopimelate desuccinylase